MLRAALLIPLLACAAAPRPAAANNNSATYVGRLAPVQVADKEAVPKGFRVRWFRANPSDAAAEAMFVAQEDLHALPWFLRAGFVPASGPAGPVVGYRLDGRSHVVELPPLVISELPATPPDDVSAEPAIKTITSETIDGRECRLFQGQLPSGRVARVAVDAQTGQLVRYSGIIVMGRGDRFELTMKLEDSKSLSSKESAAVAALAGRIKAVLPDVSDAADPVAVPVPQATLDEVSKQREQWLSAARDTPYQTFIDDVLRDVANRQKSHERVRDAAKQLLGRPAPQLPATRLDGTPLEPATLKGKTIVLHFWDYDIEPLTAPFGQVGALDFLARKHAQEDVAVIGIAVDSDFGNSATGGAAMQSSRQFVEFMNLDYAVCRDDGTLLQKFGDPLSLEANLPIWVVIGPQGEVQYYKAGLFEEKPGEGLKALEAAITMPQ